MKSIAEANKVSCLKLIWKLLSSPSSLWVRWVKNYLIQKGSLWSVKENSTWGSWIWKKLLKYRGIAQGFSKSETQNGETTSFWFDIWTPYGRLFDITGSRGCIDLGVRLDAIVDVVIKTHRRRRHRVTILNDIENQIQQIKEKGLSEQDDVKL